MLIPSRHRAGHLGMHLGNLMSEPGSPPSPERKDGRQYRVYMLRPCRRDLSERMKLHSTLSPRAFEPLPRGHCFALVYTHSVQGPSMRQCPLVCGSDSLPN